MNVVKLYSLIVLRWYEFCFVRWMYPSLCLVSVTIHMLSEWYMVVVCRHSLKIKKNVWKVCQIFCFENWIERTKLLYQKGFCDKILFIRNRETSENIFSKIVPLRSLWSIVNLIINRISYRMQKNITQIIAFTRPIHQRSIIG